MHFSSLFSKENNWKENLLRLILILSLYSAACFQVSTLMIEHINEREDSHQSSEFLVHLRKLLSTTNDQNLTYNGMIDAFAKILLSPKTILPTKILFSSHHFSVFLPVFVLLCFFIVFILSYFIFIFWQASKLCWRANLASAPSKPTKPSSAQS